MVVLDSSEEIIRWIFDPRHIKNGKIKDNFISLRPGEDCISFFRLSYAGKVRAYNNALRIKGKNIFYGGAKAYVGNITDINPNAIFVKSESYTDTHTGIYFKN